ncbi:MAG: histidine kinase [Oceanicaulis sp.]|uniref:histidine kinase n=1 Tax=Glycocaulis sp. TaxID=1969725 RepID=UPI0025BFC1E6|nr:histidine kinase [Glycocaulis sp.]MCC5980403.1 histidine kinase [Oceanicaulis sp.]MCH8520930.1 histidine kinase [Glycocaulis sp.]
MTRFLKSESNPGGRRLEDILMEIRADVLIRCTKISDDVRPEALHVMNNNVKILEHLTAAIDLAQDSTQLLDRAFGPSEAEHGGPPRIGVA